MHESYRGKTAYPLRHALGAFADARALVELRRAVPRVSHSPLQWLRGWGRDTRLAARSLRRSPGFAAVAILTLGLGMGGSTAIYTLLDRIVLDPLPYPQPERLVQLRNQVPGVGPNEVWSMSTAQQVFFSEHAGSFAALGLYRAFGANIHTPEGPRRSFGWQLTASVLPLLGAGVSVGRLIDVEDDRPDRPAVLMLSHGFWRRNFGADPTVVGQSISIDDRPHEVIGVLDPGVRIPGSPPGFETDLWMPMQIDPQGEFGNNHVFPMIGRLAAGTNVEAAEVELATLTAQLPERFARAYSQEFFDRYGFRTEVTPLKESVVGEISRSLWILFAAVGIVLLIACANVANLFVVRTQGRGRELGVRWALGAGRATLARYLLAESLVLSAAGGALAMMVTLWGVPALLALEPQALPRLQDVSIDLGTVAFTLAMTLTVGLGLAVYPLARMAGGDVLTLQGNTRVATAAKPRQRVRSALVVVQVALALTLVVGAGLLIASMQRLHATDAGIAPEGVLTAQIHLTPRTYTSDTRIWSTYSSILDRLAALPGVEGVGMSQELPITGGFGCTVQGFEDASVYARVEAAGMTTCAGEEPTTPGYFEALGIPVIRGRTFTSADNDDPSTGAVVVSRAFAERFWPGEDPIGKGVAPRGRTAAPFYRMVGVVDDVPAGSLDGEHAVAIYYPITHIAGTEGNWSRWWRPTTMSLAVRTELADPLSLLPQIRRAVAQVDASIPVTSARSMEQVVAQSTARFRFVSALLGIAASIALLLAAVGLYGVVSYIIGASSREIGTRIALGARPRDVERLFVRRSLVLIAVGLAIGVAIAASTSQLMGGLLYGVAPTDATTFASGAALLVTVALAASWIPARRSARGNPLDALRGD